MNTQNGEQREHKKERKASNTKYLSEKMILTNFQL